MALRVWLPLNGNLNNQGISNVRVTNTGATINNNGKIGKAYEFGANHWLRLEKYAAEFLTYKEFSLSVWFKCTAHNTSHGGSALISAGNWNQPSNLLNLGLSEWSTDHYTRLIISGSGTWSAGYDYNFNLNTWYHVVLTSGNGKMRAYVNGELIGDTYNAFTPNTLEQDWVCIGNGTYYSGFIFNGLMNDVRIYDECLSVKQVKELSKGLVVHYKLKEPGGNPNLLGKKDYWWSNNSANATVSNYVVTMTCNSQWAGICPNSNIMKVGGNFVLSYKFKKINGTLKTIGGHVGSKVVVNKWTFDGEEQSVAYASPLYISDDTDTHEVVVYITTTTESDGALWIQPNRAVEDSITAEVWDIKIESGTEKTDWVPSATDALYNGFNNSYIPDSSGYGRNGTITGTLTFSPDSSRYSGSIYFNGSSRISHPNGLIKDENQEWTCMAWVKPTVNASNTYLNNFNMGNQLYHAAAGNALLYLNSGDNDSYTYSNKPIPKNEWTHVAFVFKNQESIKKVYLNGVDCSGTGPTRQIPLGIPDTINIGNNFTGYMNDYREYATALSANDIKQIYQASAIIDNGNNVYTYEFVEK